MDISVTGSVLREGTNLRSQVKLTRSNDGTLIWNGTKLRSITDLPILARLIAQEVATRIGARLAPMPARTADSLSPELYELMLRGIYLKSRFDPDDLAGAVVEFDEALKMRPGYQRALKLRGDAELQLLAWGGSGGARETRLVQAGMLRRVPQRDMEEAERLVEQADAEMRRGRPANACRLLETVIELDPRSAPAYALRSLDQRAGKQHSRSVRRRRDGVATRTAALGRCTAFRGDDPVRRHDQWPPAGAASAQARSRAARSNSLLGCPPDRNCAVRGASAARRGGTPGPRGRARPAAWLGSR